MEKKDGLFLDRLSGRRADASASSHNCWRYAVLSNVRRRTTSVSTFVGLSALVITSRGQDPTGTASGEFRGFDSSLIDNLAKPHAPRGLLNSPSCASRSKSKRRFLTPLVLDHKHPIASPPVLSCFSDKYTTTL